MILVTKTYFPDFLDYSKQLQRIWKNQWLTNRGELVLELEEKIKKKLHVPNIIITTNGTIPLQIALKILGNKGEIVTTPFSYVATSAAIIWENCTPVFVDIDPNHFTIDETKIEAAITSKTTAILATHVFGNPCNVEVIEQIAKKYNLSVIYDAAHCFGVQYKNNSIFNFGDVSTCSFHATKLFHTGEGGAMFTNNLELHKKLFYSHNFGHDGPIKFHGLGINGKASELQAAMGLAVLPDIDYIIQERKKVVEYYEEGLDVFKYQKMKLREHTLWNYSYYPILFQDEKILLEKIEELNQNNIYPRRYFYPSLNTINYINGSSMPNSEKIASTILCLPLYVGLEEHQLNQIITILNS